MSDGFDAGGALRRSEPVSATRFLVITLLVTVVLAAATGWFLVERRGAWQVDAQIDAAAERRNVVSDVLIALGSADRLGEQAAASREARSAAGDALAALDRGTMGPPDWTVGAARLRALAGAALAERDGARARALADAANRIGADLRARETRRIRSEMARLNARHHRVDQVMRLVAASAIAAWLLGMATVWRAHRRRSSLQADTANLAARLHAVFAGAGDAMLILATDGLVEAANPAAGRLFDRPPEELVGLDVTALVDAEDEEEARRGLLALAQGRVSPDLRLERLARRRDGGGVPVDIAFGLMPLGDGTRVVASLRDASERQAAERLKDDFISTISHELRTPLTSVVGALGLLREGAAGHLSDAAGRLVEIAENNSRRLIRLVNDILDIDRLGSGRIRLDVKPLDVVEVAARAVRDAEGLATPRGITLSLVAVGPLSVSGDADRVMQVIGNLLANAIRFSPARGEVLVTVEARGGEAVVRVEDVGPGVPHEFRDRLFGRFTQSTAGAAIPGGTGLGLAISREIVRAHGGEIWYADRKGGGAQFCFTLPLAPTEADTGRRRLLLCEDDARIAALMRELIEDDGYLVDRCGTAGEALAMARTGRYDALLLDLTLPDADGLDALRAIRAQPESADLPVLVVSGSAVFRQADPGAADLRVAAWLNKPVNHARLLRALDGAIRSADTRRPVLLHVEDDPDVRAVVALALADRGRIVQAGSIGSARAVLAAVAPAAAILDLDLPDGSGLDLLPDLAGDRAGGRGGRVPVVVYSAASNLPEPGGGVDAVLTKSARSLLVLSEAVGAVLQPVPELENG